ncbi:MAG: aminotransferase class V-fold PLP-dependent enzyme, partial [Candidatus Heimdallarchaeaceae archaeon]
AYILVDTIQSTGALQNDVKDWNVDFLSCGVAKWLLGPSQAGFLYIKNELIDEFEPPFAGYYGVEYGSKEEPYWDPTKLEYVPSVEKFVDVNPKELIFSIANEGMKVILEYGIDKIEKRVIQLMDYLIESLSSIPNIAFLTPLEPEYRSSIVNVKVANNIEIAKKLRERHIITSSRYGGIRISPHFYNTEDDLDLLVITLKELIN